MKYIDADKLRAKIDAFYTKYKAKFHQNGDSYHLGIIDGLDMAERILDTLEEPVSEDLEKEIDAYYKEWDGDCRYVQTARHFAKWMRAKMMEGAVECVVCAGMEGDKWIMTYIGSYESMLKTCKAGDKVRIIIVKEDNNGH